MHETATTLLKPTELEKAPLPQHATTGQLARMSAVSLCSKQLGSSQADHDCGYYAGQRADRLLLSVHAHLLKLEA